MASTRSSYNKDNKFALKLTTDELKQEAYKQYCDHLSKGYPKEAWWFEHPDVTICFKTMENYIKESPKDFPTTHRTKAHSKGLKHWIDVGINMMTSQDRCQPAIFQIMMRNIYGWDKESVEEKVDKEKKEKSLLDAVWESLDSKYKATQE